MDLPTGVNAVDKRIVRLWVDTDRWRYHCPSDHTSWVPNEMGFYCQQCGSAFPALVDTAIGEDVEREEFHLLGSRFSPPSENVQSMLSEY